MDIFKHVFFWFVVAMIVVIFPIAGAIIAEHKGRNPRGWSLGCLLFPLSGLLILLVVPRLKPGPGETKRSGGSVEGGDADTR